MADSEFGYDLDPAKMDDFALVVLVQDCGFLPARNALLLRHEDLKNSLVDRLSRCAALRPEDVGDARQEAIGWIIEAIERYDTSQIGKTKPCSFKSFMITKIVSRFHDFVKHLWTVERHYDRSAHEMAEFDESALQHHASLMADAWQEDPMGDPAALAELRETMTRLHAALEQLNGGDREIWQRLAAGKDPHAIASELELSYYQVNRRKRKILDELRARFGEPSGPAEQACSKAPDRVRTELKQQPRPFTSTGSAGPSTHSEEPVENQEPDRGVLKLPLRCLLALAVRCARRAERFFSDSDASARCTIEQATAKAGALAIQGPGAAGSQANDGGESAIKVARCTLDAARQALQDAAQQSVQTEIDGTNAIIRAAQPVPPGAADVIAAKRDEALADFRAAADRARQLAHEFAAEKVAAAGQKLREAEATAAEAAHATVLATHETAQAARAVLRAASEALAAFDAKATDALEADLARLSLLGDELNANPPFGPAIDPAETGPLGPLWPAGEPVWFHAPQQALAQIPKRTLLAMRLEHIVTALASLSQALDRMPY